MLRPLKTRFDIKAWYQDIKAAGQPVAWCSAFSPAEFLLAAGITPVYPENHAAMLGALSPDRDPAHPFSEDAIARSEAKGWTTPQLCSYAQADLGALLSGPSPIDGLPKPDLFYSCDSQCAVVERWGNAVQQHFATQGQDLPHCVLHAPPLTRDEQHAPETIAAFLQTIEAHMQELSDRLGLRYDPQRLQEVAEESARANRLWQACLELGRNQPAPWSNTDAFQAMAPIVIARGTKLCTRYYQALYEELQERITAGTHAIAHEEKRLLWDAIPIWPLKNWLAERCARHNAVIVASTYTHSWWFDIDTTPGNTATSLAERYAWNTMNRSGKWVLDWTKELYQSYACDGIISHWNASCGIWNSFVKRRLPGFREAKLPHLLLQADMVDARHIDHDRLGSELDAFLESLS